MTFNTFKSRLVEDLNSRYPSKLNNIELEISDIAKPGCKYSGLIARDITSNVAPVINIDGYYDLMKSDDEYDDVLDKMICSIITAIELSPNVEISDYEAIKDKLFIQVIGENNDDYNLSNIPHKKFEDMEIIYRIAVNRGDKVVGTAVVTNDIIKSFGVDVDTLHYDAIESAVKTMPLTHFNLPEFMASNYGFFGDGLEDVGMYIFSNESGMYGASVILYPEFIEKAKSVVGEDFYILPSSMHEVILTKKSCSDIGYLKSMVSDINDEVVPPEDILTYNIYHVNNGIIEMV